VYQPGSEEASLLCPSEHLFIRFLYQSTIEVDSEVGGFKALVVHQCQITIHYSVVEPADPSQGGMSLGVIGTLVMV
jgi:hypothetical protein